MLQFLATQKGRQANHFPLVKYDKVLSFMGTTSQPGTHATLSVVPLRRLEPGSSSSEMKVHLGGPLPRQPARGECITVHLTRVEQFQGYQIKTKALPSPGSEGTLYQQPGADDLVILGHQIFTVHHSPYTLKFFEQIPYDEVEQILSGVKVALVGVGMQVNISPRFIFHYEQKLDRVVLFHGDGLALKTYMNLKSNRQETRLVLDLDTFEGFVLRGTVEEFAPHQHPEAYDKICQGFIAGNWGKPSRVFRFVADQWTPIAPTGFGAAPPARAAG
jgi:hypothetical protein